MRGVIKELDGCCAVVVLVRVLEDDGTHLALAT